MTVSVSVLNEEMENKETIRDIAIKLSENKQKSELDSENASRCLFFMGSKSCGKTTLINLFLEKEDQVNETLGLEYTYGRKNIQSNLTEKTICHVWELGGDMFKTPDIMSVPLKAHKSSQITVIIYVDLTQPKLLWSTLESCVQNLNSAIEKQSLSSDDNGNMSRNKFGTFPLPLIVVGGKYELFNELDAGFKKSVTKSLRCVCCLLGASLIYFSKNDQTIKKRMKDVLNNVGFGTESRIKGTIQDFNKPVFVTAGTDSWESIGVGKSSWDEIKHAYTLQFPQIVSDTVVPEDPSLEANYKEPLIDSMRNQREEELKMMMNKSVFSNF